MGRSDQARRHQVRVAFVIPDCRKRQVRNPYPLCWGYGFRAPRCARPRNDGSTFLAAGLDPYWGHGETPRPRSRKAFEKRPGQADPRQGGAAGFFAARPGAGGHAESRDRPRPRRRRFADWFSLPPPGPRWRAPECKLVGGGRGGGSGGEVASVDYCAKPLDKCASPPDPHPYPLPTRGRGRASVRLAAAAGQFVRPPRRFRQCPSGAQIDARVGRAAAERLCRQRGRPASIRNWPTRSAMATAIRPSR